LDALAERGLVEIERDTARKHNANQYRLTDAGRDALADYREWVRADE
jgi:DNA-binding PadR family transcriptional regulator